MAHIAIPLAITAGGMALQYLLTPRIKQQPVDKGKMDDIRIQGSDYGAIIPRTWGKTRQAGLVVWSSGVDTYLQSTPGNNSKKNPQAPVSEYTYKTSFGIVFCRNHVVFQRIWDESTLFIDQSPSATGRFEAEDPAFATLSGGASIYAHGSASGGEAVENLGLGGQIVFDISSLVDPDPEDPDDPAFPMTRISFYYRCPTDMPATVDTDVTAPQTVVFLASPDEWTAKTILIDGFADTVTYYHAPAAAPDIDLIVAEKFFRLRDRSYHITGIINPNIAYPPDLDDPSEYHNYALNLALDAPTGVYTFEVSVPVQQVRLYTATETQLADSKLKNWLDIRYGAGQGVLRASAMRGLSLMVVQDYTLKSNALSQFTAETDTEDDTVNAILTDLFTDVGLEAADYNIAATASYTQVGFIEHTNASRRALIESLERYHLFRIAEIDGKIVTVPDSWTPVGAINTDDLRAHTDSEAMPASDAEVLIKDEILFPREVKVSVMNPDLDYHNETARTALFTDIVGKEAKEYTFPIVDPLSRARTQAEKLLLKEYSEDRAFEAWGMPTTARYAIGDVVTATLNDQDYNVRIEKKQLTLPIGKVRFQCVSVSPFVPSFYQDAVTSGRPTAESAKNFFPRNTVIFPIQSEPIRHADKGRLGLYLAVGGRGRGDGTGPAGIYRETAEDNFDLQQTISTSSVLGLCEDILATHANLAVEDTTNVLDIWFFDDIDLETVTQADIDRNPLANLLRVGDEWLQFRTATAQALEDNSPYKAKWRVSNLWRGKFGTPVSSHIASEYACLATPNLLFYDLEPEDVGQTVTLKAVTAGQGIDLAPETSFVFAGSLATEPVVPIFDHFTDATTTGTSEETLYIDQIDAGTLAVNGDKVTAEYAGVFAANGNAKNLFFYFNAGGLFSVNVTENDTNWRARFTLTRVSNTVLRYAFSFESAVAWEPITSSFTGLDLDANDYDIILTAYTPTAAGDVTAKMAHGLFIPAAVTNTNWLTDDGEGLTDGGDELSDTE